MFDSHSKGGMERYFFAYRYFGRAMRFAALRVFQLLFVFRYEKNKH